MNRYLLSFLSGVLFSLPILLPAQVDLPYYSGFDNASERAGWKIYRTGENPIANWSIATFGGYSPTSCISHDYAPSSGANLADDWYISPAFFIPSGGTLDSVRYFFSGFSVPADDDTIGIFLLTGSQNPLSASSISLLADFRGDKYQADAMYRLLTDISLPATQDSAYIAIRYRNGEVSSRWLTVRFDNIAISGLTTSVDPPASGWITSVYPNPCSDILNILHSGESGTITICDYMGTTIHRTTIIQDQSLTSVPVDYLPGGIFFITIQQAGHIASSRFIKN